MDTATRLWRLVDYAEPIWRSWDGEYVIHHALSNDTHRLSDAAGQVLAQMVQAGELTASSLAERCGLSESELATILSVLAQLDFAAGR
jgi:hypothetical protein